MMKSMGEKLSQKQIVDMMKFADLNGDGKIDYQGILIKTKKRT